LKNVKTLADSTDIRPLVEQLAAYPALLYQLPPRQFDEVTVEWRARFAWQVRLASAKK